MRDGDDAREWGGAEVHPWVAESRRTLGFGIGTTTIAPEVDGATRLRLARTVEELGLDSLWVPDHPSSTMDCWTMLAAYASVTSRIRLGPLVSCVFYRSTFQLARQAADVDRISNGRLILGLGTGSFTPEFPLLGLPVPDLKDRQRTMRATLRDLQRLWYGEPYRVILAERRIEGSSIRFGPVQRPRPPLLIAGGGEQVTLRRVAQVGDACNLEGQDANLVRHKLDVLKAHCDVVGRDYDAVLRTHMGNLTLLAPSESAAQRKAEALAARGALVRRAWTPREMIAHYEPFVRAGVQHLIVNLTAHDDIETAELLVDHVIPELRALV